MTSVLTRRSSEVRRAMSTKSNKGPLRRGGLRGRHEPKREHNKSGGRVREDDDDKNWTKKFQEGELDDLLVTGREEDDEDDSEDAELEELGDSDADDTNS
jgi:hypothetical protein